MTHDSPQNDDPENLERDLQAMVEGKLDPERFTALQERMKTDRELLKRYLAAVRTDHLLTEQPWEVSAVEKVIPFPKIHRRAVIRGIAVAAAILVGVLFVSNLLRPGTNDLSPQIADSEGLPEVEFNPEAVFETSAPSGRLDGRLYEGDFVAMHEGFVSIKLPSGVEAMIESPSNFAITGKNRLKLDRGKAWFRVPEQAIGFAVDLPWMKVVDLGTVFTTTADTSINQVQVHQGRVEVHISDFLPEPKMLGEGEALTFGADQSLQVGKTAGGFHQPNSPEPESVFHDLLNYVPNQAFENREALIGSWHVADGKPLIRDGRFDAQEDSALVFGEFPERIEPGSNAVILLSFRSKSPKNFFHSKGWAGVSLFDGEHECFFLGDKSNDSYSWALMAYGYEYVPTELPRAPRYDLPIQGSEETFTVRYRQKTGEIEIYRGWGIHGVPVLREATDKNLGFDRIRIASGEGGDFSFDEVQVLVAREGTE